MLNKVQKKASSPLIRNLAICIVSIIGLMIVLYTTKWGAALSDDSYYYISSARNLLAGRGFDLESNFPPVLPLLLSLIGLFKVDPLISIRWLNAMLFAVNIYLVARIVYSLTKSSIFSILGALFTLVSSTLIMVHSWAMSEALFIAFTLAGLLVYALGYDKESWRLALFTGLFFGLAAATRYIGVALLLAGGLFWLTEAGKSYQLRIRNAIIFSLIGLIPLLLWMVRNLILTGGPTNRVFNSHLMPASMWVNMLNTVLLWLIPGRFVKGKELFWLAGIILVLLIWAVVTLVRNRSRTALRIEPISQRKPITLIVVCMLAYMLVLVISRSFFDDRIPMDERLLSPILVIGLPLLFWLFSRLWRTNKWLVAGVIVIVSMLFLVTNLTRSYQMVASYHDVGRGYASARDHISETYAYLRNRPNVPVYSNAFGGIYFWTGRVTMSLPSPGGIPAMKTDMRQTGAYLVIFDSIPVELYGTTRDVLTQGLVEQIKLSEATIYRSP